MDYSSYANSKYNLYQTLKRELSEVVFEENKISFYSKDDTGIIRLHTFTPDSIDSVVVESFPVKAQAVVEVEEVVEETPKKTKRTKKVQA
jgi:hypothetical protein